MSRFDQIQSVPRVDWQRPGFLNDMFNWEERYPNFKPEELCCFHCGLLMVNPKALTTLQQTRKLWKSPMVVNSGTRCAHYNGQVGGAPNSYHLRGMAFDIHMPHSWTGKHVASFLYYATVAGFRGFGLYKTFIHLDIGPHRTWEQGDSRLDPFDNNDPNELI